jgi:hypothetical protein
MTLTFEFGSAFWRSGEIFEEAPNMNRLEASHKARRRTDFFINDLSAGRERAQLKVSTSILIENDCQLFSYAASF